MNAHSTVRGPGRGAHLVAGGKRASAGTGRFAKLLAGGFHRILDRIDDGLEHGTMLARLPDGTERVLGGRGEGPLAEIDLTHWNALLRLATGGSAGWYQAWEAREWSSSDPVQIFALFMQNAGHLGGIARAKGPWRWLLRRLHWLQRNTRDGARKNVAAHYDLGNDFYAAWLDPSMTYSSALDFTPGDTLEMAQRRKLDRIAGRVGVQNRAKVLEIGCGWGSLAQRLAEDGAAVRAVSLSAEQLDWARVHNAVGKAAPAYELTDYRALTGQYDAIVSVEMIEAVGREWWPSFVDCLARCLKPGARAVLQYIWIRDDLFDAYAASADFIQTYVFPGGMLIRESELRSLAAARGLEWRDQEDFGLAYAETLHRWRNAFDAAVDEGRLPIDFDERFVRLWRYYLMYCEGGFLGGGIGVSQVTLVKSR